jgi:hypothetical protein
MTALTDRTPDVAASEARPRGVPPHRPLLALAAAMAVLAAVSTVGLIVDPREVLGAPLWAKPLKFALSILIYAVTFAWLIGLTHGRLRRVAWWAGTVATIGLIIEMVIIVGAAAAGGTSHFNVSTPFATALWSIMAASIAVVWVATLVVAIALFRAPLGDAARTLAIRAGSVIALGGMALAFLMTSPTSEQLSDFRGVAGAHAVGVADGGPGIPILGWSTDGGDLRIPHFVGMHALQGLILLVLALEWASRRIALLADGEVRRRLVGIAAVLWLGTVIIVTVQALAGESIVRPSTAITTAAVALGIVGAIAATWVLGRGLRRIRRSDLARG